LGALRKKRHEEHLALLYDLRALCLPEQ